MKVITRLVLAGTLAFSSPFVLPAMHTEAQAATLRIFRLKAEVLFTGPLSQSVPVVSLDPNSPLRGWVNVGDSIYGVNGTPTPSLDVLNQVLAMVLPDTDVTFEIRIKDSPLNVITRTIHIQ
jgi:hypothetical protein